MSIERAEQLKEKLTDKYVVVDQSIPELRRFAEWTGKVKTVNMSCRALVEFDGPVDIGWYDINPDYLIVVDGPRPKAAPAAKAPAAKAPWRHQSPQRAARVRWTPFAHNRRPRRQEPLRQQEPSRHHWT